MASARKEESAAIQMQYWWRRHLKRNEELAEKARRISEWRGLQDISLHNTELIEQLKAIRRRKAYDLMKYEHILQLPARKVTEYLSKESEAPAKLVKDESEEILERIEYERRHNAAKVIQRAFKNYHRKKVAGRYLRRITEIRPQRRVELIAQINDRLNERKTLRKDHITVIKERLATYRAAREKDADAYAKRQLVIQSMKRDILVLNSITAETSITPGLLKCLGSTRPLAHYKASLSHESEMERIDDKLLGLHI
ncbi:hypothetical protein Y032_0634g911 [Ancylostoma ceylanicum]|uniref:Uncharacterized protein n=1 Tax=Ancylostoma ceylanicum TaxID=53326 RepID=A0A016WK67_9BILA|nr:hypothetical protein Y032_0634g911 [Ancylostoma ceylanicum]